MSALHDGLSERMELRRMGENGALAPPACPPGSTVRLCEWGRGTGSDRSEPMEAERSSCEAHTTRMGSELGSLILQVDSEVARGPLAIPSGGATSAHRLATSCPEHGRGALARPAR